MSIILVPTSHIARESLENVKKAVEKHNPDCIAIELDPIRYQSMITEQKGSSLDAIRSLGFTFIIYWIMKQLQKSLSSKTGIFPGTEMLYGIEIAKKHGLPYAFIDQRIDITLNGIKSISISEKFKLFWLLIIGMIGLALPIGKEKIDLNKVPPEEYIEMSMRYLKDHLPGIYKVLIDDRNRIMVNSLIKLNERFDKIVCIIGAGHKKGMIRLLKAKKKKFVTNK